MSDSSRPGSRDGLWWVVGVLLAIPIIFPLLVGTYAKAEPTLAGFPFFFWYQFLWIAIASALVFVCFQLVTRKEQRDQDERGDRS